jgi:2-polyprenyl-3-methyl-5-hydroxy-6-metoxy-1,4-benzoquinol methylase
LDLPEGSLHPGEHIFDAALRIPLETAGFRIQRFHPFAADGTHLYAWVDGDRYGPGGSKPYTPVELIELSPEEAAVRLRACEKEDAALIVERAAADFRSQSDESYYADNLRMFERTYLAATTPEGGSGFGRDRVAWRKARKAIVDGVTASGTFLDVGCANGLLMESVAQWAAERGLAIEPYGIDFAPGLIDLARRRLPCWADRLWVGNAVDWLPPDGLRFDYVHTLLDCVPVGRRSQMIRYQLANMVKTGGRLLISQYLGTGGTPQPPAAEILRSLGFRVAGESSPPDPAFAGRTSHAWIDALP